MKRSYAILDNVGFTVHLLNRASFSPDAAFYTEKVSSDLFS